MSVGSTVKTILSDVVKGLKVFFVGATKVAQVAEPIVDVAFPGIAALYNGTVNLAIQAETAAIAAGAQSGTGPQKLALVVSQVTPIFETYAKQNGINVDPTVITNWVNAVVATLNAIPASNPATPAPAAPVVPTATTGV